MKGQLLKLLVMMDRPVVRGDDLIESFPHFPDGVLWYAKVVGTDHEIIVDASNWPLPETMKVIEEVGCE